MSEQIYSYQSMLFQQHKYNTSLANAYQMWLHLKYNSNTDEVF